MLYYACLIPNYLVWKLVICLTGRGLTESFCQKKQKPKPVLIPD